MHFFTLTPMYLLLSLTLLSHNVYGRIIKHPLSELCSVSDNYTTDSPFENNLNSLMFQLSSNFSQTGFEMKSVGKDGDGVYGLGSCRGDVRSYVCESCITEAGYAVVKACKTNTAGIVWYENCLLKYSNTNFFSTIEYENKFYMMNTRNASTIVLANVSNVVETFNLKTKLLISNLTAQACSIPQLFAAGTSRLGTTVNLHGYVQCTRDLTDVQCKKCLGDAANELGKCCEGKLGARFYSGNRNLRYELYPYLLSRP